MSDYYQILGLERNATDKEIKTAYKRLALQWHPDKNPNNAEEASQKFKKIAEAYQVLSNEQSRREYDERLNGGGSSSSARRSRSSSRTFAQSPNDFFSFHFRSPEEIFAEFFGEDPFQDFFEDDFHPFRGFGFGFGSNASMIHEEHMQPFAMNLNLNFPLGQTYRTVVQAAPGSFRATSTTRSSNQSSRSGSQHKRRSSKNHSVDRGDSGGPSRNNTITCSSTTTRVVNGKRITVQKTLENNVETTSVYENDVLTSRTVQNMDPLSAIRSVKQ